MSQALHDSKELENIYGRRFDGHIRYRDQVWKILTSEFFTRYVSPDCQVLDLRSWTVFELKSCLDECWSPFKKSSSLFGIDRD